MTRNPNWTRDEHMIALNHYLQNPKSWFGESSEDIQKLSAQIRSVAEGLGLKGDDTFRNTAGVSMKLLNFRRLDQNHTARGLPRGSKDEEAVWNDYADRPDELRRTVVGILSTVKGGECKSIFAPGDWEEAQEGEVLTRLHRYRERNTALVRKKKTAFIKSYGRLYCEACGFDFVKVYGARGEGFIECHHKIPVSELGPGQKTKLSDLVLLCANCHRMVHSARPWLSVEELVEIL
ncbi:HNH endonuclease [Pseudophaeobacter profundi]|uniref:HNH endonuclease n=1 Tax=Pseudophaeobacter profundi TaxID=3034152 RepID=UPI0024307509|nr:HNH endonuclease [Pseudophaeobacter profundi]